jgi:tRNA-2-methylthio-N6-dimethylallyladenosine synthase
MKTERKMMIMLMLLMLIMYMLSCNSLVNDIKSVPYRINKIVHKESIIAIRLRHIAVLSEELANDCKNMIVTGSTDFSKLADFSICINTKHKGGDTGWINTKTNDGSASIDIIPPELINAAFSLNKGDIIVTSSRDFYNNNDNSNLIGDSSSKVYHVVQLLDVMSELSPSLIKRRRDNFLAVKGIDTISKQKMTYTFETMGCQMNFADTERMEGQLQELGYIKVDDDSDNSADVVVLNTCAIRDHAEQKVYSKIGPYASKKRNGEDVSIIVAGCVAQQEGEQLARRFPEIDIVMGPQYAGRLSELMEQVAEGSQVVAVDAAYQTEDSTVAKRKSDISGWVNVIYGCNERCTYCVVPNTRGVEQSRTKEGI